MLCKFNVKLSYLKRLIYISFIRYHQDVGHFTNGLTPLLRDPFILPMRMNLYDTYTVLGEF